jgi:transcriptional regulator with XRE-family HTH domain
MALMMAMTPTTPAAATGDHDNRTPAPRTLREYLKTSGVSQKQLARRLGVHQSTISMLVHGLRAARFKLAQKIHDKTGVPIEKLLVAAHPRPRRR